MPWGTFSPWFYRGCIPVKDRSLTFTPNAIQQGRLLQFKARVAHGTITNVCKQLFVLLISVRIFPAPEAAALAWIVTPRAIYDSDAIISTYLRLERSPRSLRFPVHFV